MCLTSLTQSTCIHEYADLKSELSMQYTVGTGEKGRHVGFRSVLECVRRECERTE